MTNEAREAIARAEVAHLSGLTIEGVNKREWGEVDAFIKLPYWERGWELAGRILSLKYPTGEDMIAIQDIDQSFPELPNRPGICPVCGGEIISTKVYYQTDRSRLYCKGSCDSYVDDHKYRELYYLNEDWRKVVKR